MKPIDEIMAIITQKGEAISQADIDQISFLIVDIPLDEAPDVVPWIWESIALIVNAPEYQGDAAPIE